MIFDIMDIAGHVCAPTGHVYLTRETFVREIKNTVLSGVRKQDEVRHAGRDYAGHESNIYHATTE